MAVRAPHLHLTLRAFCLGAFVFLGRALEEGDELPFAFEEHVQRQGPALYEYRPLVRSFVESRANALAKRDDALLRARGAAPRAGGRDLRARPCRAEADRGAGALPHRPALAPDLDRRGVRRLRLGRPRVRARVRRAGAVAVRRARAYAAVAPLVGLSVVTQVELGGGIRLRAAATGELAHHWPEAQGLLPAGFGREVDRYCVLELERELEPGEEPPDAPAELADAVSAIRLATAAPVAAGPVLFERLDWRPFGIRPVLPIAATQPPGEPTRLDSFRAEVTREVLGRLALADADAPLRRGARPLGALAVPERAVPLRAAARRARRPARGDVGASRRRAARRASEERRAIHSALRSLAEGEQASERAEAAVRRSLVETLRHGDRAVLVRSLDDALLGLRAAAGA